MDVATLVSALAGAQQGQVQIAVAARMARMNADMEASVAKLVEAGQQNLERLASVGAGIGGNLDISV
jgi:hypothetical protein